MGQFKLKSLLFCGVTCVYGGLNVEEASVGKFFENLTRNVVVDPRQLSSSEVVTRECSSVGGTRCIPLGYSKESTVKSSPVWYRHGHRDDELVKSYNDFESAYIHESLKPLHSYNFPPPNVIFDVHLPELLEFDTGGSVMGSALEWMSDQISHIEAARSHETRAPYAELEVHDDITATDADNDRPETVGSKSQSSAQPVAERATTQQGAASVMTEREIAPEGQSTDGDPTENEAPFIRRMFDSVIDHVLNKIEALSASLEEVFAESEDEEETENSSNDENDVASDLGDDENITSPGSEDNRMFDFYNEDSFKEATPVIERMWTGQSTMLTLADVPLHRTTVPRNFRGALPDELGVVWNGKWNMMSQNSVRFNSDTNKPSRDDVFELRSHQWNASTDPGVCAEIAATVQELVFSRPVVVSALFVSGAKLQKTRRMQAATGWALSVAGFKEEVMLWDVNLPLADIGNKNTDIMHHVTDSPYFRIDKIKFRLHFSMDLTMGDSTGYLSNAMAPEVTERLLADQLAMEEMPGLTIDREAIFMNDLFTTPFEDVFEKSTDVFDTDLNRTNQRFGPGTFHNAPKNICFVAALLHFPKKTYRYDFTDSSLSSAVESHLAERTRRESRFGDTIQQPISCERPRSHPIRISFLHALSNQQCPSRTAGAQALFDAVSDPAKLFESAVGSQRVYEAVSPLRTTSGLADIRRLSYFNGVVLLQKRRKSGSPLADSMYSDFMELFSGDQVDNRKKVKPVPEIGEDITPLNYRDIAAKRARDLEEFSRGPLRQVFRTGTSVGRILPGMSSGSDGSVFNIDLRDVADMMTLTAQSIPVEAPLLSLADAMSRSVVLSGASLPTTLFNFRRDDKSTIPARRVGFDFSREFSKLFAEKTSNWLRKVEREGLTEGVLMQILEKLLVETITEVVQLAQKVGGSAVETLPDSVKIQQLTEKDGKLVSQTISAKVYGSEKAADSKNEKLRLLNVEEKDNKAAVSPTEIKGMVEEHQEQDAVSAPLTEAAELQDFEEQEAAEPEYFEEDVYHSDEWASDDDFEPMDEYLAPDSDLENAWMHGSQLRFQEPDPRRQAHSIYVFEIRLLDESSMENLVSDVYAQALVEPDFAAMVSPNPEYLTVNDVESFLDLLGALDFVRETMQSGESGPSSATFDVKIGSQRVKIVVRLTGTQGRPSASRSVPQQPTESRQAHAERRQDSSREGARSPATDTHTHTAMTHTYTAVTHTYTAVTHTHTAVTHTYTAVTNTHTAVTHTHTAVTHTHTAVTHTHTAVTHTHTAVTHTYTAVTHTHTAVTHTHTAVTHTHTAVTRTHTSVTSVPHTHSPSSARSASGHVYPAVSEHERLVAAHGEESALLHQRTVEQHEQAVAEALTNARRGNVEHRIAHAKSVVRAATLEVPSNDEDKKQREEKVKSLGAHLAQHVAGEV